MLITDCLDLAAFVVDCESDYRKYLPSQVIRTRLKTEKTVACFVGGGGVCFVFDTFSSAIMNDLTMTFTSGLKMDAKCANQQ